MATNYVSVTLGKHKIQDYQIVVKNRTECTLYAASELVNYVFKATGEALAVALEKSEKPAIFIECGEEFNDGFKIYLKNGDLYLVGNNERSALYAVYELLERIGWRFFASEMSFRALEVGEYMLPCEAFFAENGRLFARRFEYRTKRGDRLSRRLDVCV